MSNSISIKNIIHSKMSLVDLTMLEIENCKKKLRDSIAVEYPLLSLQGKPSIYTTALNGTIVEPLNKSSSNFLAYDIVTASELPESVSETLNINPDTLFVIYVDLEHDSSIDDKCPEFSSYLIVQIN